VQIPVRLEISSSVKIFWVDLTVIIPRHPVPTL
jgi:hypothetical protein